MEVKKKLYFFIIKIIFAKTISVLINVIVWKIYIYITIDKFMAYQQSFVNEITMMTHFFKDLLDVNYK